MILASKALTSSANTVRPALTTIQVEGGKGTLTKLLLKLTLFLDSSGLLHAESTRHPKVRENFLDFFDLLFGIVDILEDFGPDFPDTTGKDERLEWQAVSF